MPSKLIWVVALIVYDSDGNPKDGGWYNFEQELTRCTVAEHVFRHSYPPAPKEVCALIPRTKYLLGSRLMAQGFFNCAKDKCKELDDFVEGNQ